MSYKSTKDKLSGKSSGKNNVMRNVIGTASAFFVSLALFTTFYITLDSADYMDKKVMQSSGNRTGNSNIQTDSNDFSKYVTDYGGGVKGSGSYNIALALLNDGYAKDILQLYTEAGEGKYGSSSINVPKQTYLSIHYNEVGYYSGFYPLPDGPFPAQGGKIVYNEAYSGLPADAMTWFGYNTNVKDVIGYGSIVPSGEEGKTRDVFVFQMNRHSFEGATPANINGYNTSSGREADPYFLPDATVLLNEQYSDFISRAPILGTTLNSNPEFVMSMFNLRHNRGSIYNQAVGFVYHHENSKSNMLTVSSFGDEVAKEGLVFPRELKETIDRTDYSVDTNDFDTAYARAVATVMAINSGWSVTQMTYDYYTNNPMYFVRAWNKTFPSDTIDDGGVGDKLKPHVANLATELGISSSDCKRIYGTIGDYSEILQVGADTYKSGYIFKVEDYTSDIYANKMPDGSNPKVVHAYDVICAGHQFMGLLADKLWEVLLKFAMEESGIDPSDPKNWVSNPSDDSQVGGNIEMGDEFQPTIAKMYKIFNLMGIDASKENPKAVEFVVGVLASCGGWYNQDLRTAYDADRDRYYHDCSSLTAAGILKTDYGEIYGVNPQATTVYFYNNTTDLVTVCGKDEWTKYAKLGDMPVYRTEAGHVFTFVGFNNTTSPIVISKDLTMRGIDVTINPGNALVLEAHDYDYINGVFERSTSLGSNYLLRRWKHLD